jgi:hypothetical protein
MESLPNEIIVMIIDKLDHKSLACCIIASKIFHIYTDDQLIKKRMAYSLDYSVKYFPNHSIAYVRSEITRYNPRVRNIMLKPSIIHREQAKSRKNRCSYISILLNGTDLKLCYV